MITLEDYDEWRHSVIKKALIKAVTNMKYTKDKFSGFFQQRNLIFRAKKGETKKQAIISIAEEILNKSECELMGFKAVNPFLISIEMAQALWGFHQLDDEMVTEIPHPWQQHMQAMVIEVEDIKYLEKWI